MALPKIKTIDIQYLDLWFASIVDTFNYDIEKIIVAVPALAMILTNFDVAPIHYLKDSFKDLVDNINKGLDEINGRFTQIEMRLDKIEQRLQGGK